MNEVSMLVGLLVAVAIIWVYMKNSEKLNKLRIDPLEAKRRLVKDKGIILLDVRTEEEHLENHIPGSTLIPLKVLRQEAANTLPDKQATIFFYCKTGNRSRAAVRMLLKQGYTNVYDMGGIQGWPYKTISGKK